MEVLPFDHASEDIKPLTAIAFSVLGGYAQAAPRFRQVYHHECPATLRWDTLITFEDIATYAAITSMATAARTEVLKMLHNRKALEFLFQPIGGSFVSMGETSQLCKSMDTAPGITVTPWVGHVLAAPTSCIVPENKAGFYH